MSTAAMAATAERVRDVETDIVETFNEHIARVLDTLRLDIERVWLERRIPDAADADTDAAAGLAEASVFKLHVARAGEDGTVHADSVDNLSESEREVVGLVVALAGYLVHEVYADVPFVVLDAVEALDADRLAALLAYIDEYAECTVAAVLDAHTDAADLDAQADTVITTEHASAAD